MRLQRGALLVAVAALVLSVGACGADDQGGSARSDMVDMSDPNLLRSRWA